MADEKKKRTRQFYAIEYELHDSPMWRSTSRIARDLYMQIKARRNRRDKEGNVINPTDGKIEFGYTDSFGLSKPSFVAGIEELRIKGFIRLVEPGHFPRVKAKYAIINKWKRLSPYYQPFEGQFDEGEDYGSENDK